MADITDRMLEKATDDIVSDAFSKGHSVSYMEGGKLIREYPNGTKKQIVYVDGKRSEIDYHG
jgi:hypothetical protein